MALASATIDNAPVIEGGKKMISLTVSGVIKLD
jgi:predicted secreted protein